MPDAIDTLTELIQAIHHEANTLRAQITDCTHQNALLQEQTLRLFTRNTGLERINRQLQEQALTDPMTGIRNYRAFREQMTSAFSLARRHNLPLSLILMDLDHFKQFNDTYGHPAGDTRLRRVAGLLQQHVRQSDFVARYGGEEFVFILPSTDANGALHQAQRLRQAVEQTTVQSPEQSAAHAHSIPLTGSFGVSTLRAEMVDVDALVDEADIAMYAAKQSGRNRALHFETLTLIQRAPTDRSRFTPPSSAS